LPPNKESRERSKAAFNRRSALKEPTPKPCPRCYLPMKQISTSLFECSRGHQALVTKKR